MKRLSIGLTEMEKMNTRQRKQILEKFLGHKIDGIVFGSIVKTKGIADCGEFRVRHQDECAYSNIKVKRIDENTTEFTIYDFEKKEWI